MTPHAAAVDDRNAGDGASRIRRSQPFEPGQPGQRFVAAAPAHVGGGSERTADPRTLRLPEKPAAELRVEIHARNPRRLSVRHTRDRR